ncbi:hypothetical protein CsSME_00038660 [Camellia sinensis var. sinensis]
MELLLLTLFLTLFSALSVSSTQTIVQGFPTLTPQTSLSVEKETDFLISPNRAFPFWVLQSGHKRLLFLNLVHQFPQQNRCLDGQPRPPR